MAERGGMEGRAAMTTEERSRKSKEAWARRKAALAANESGQVIGEKNRDPDPQPETARGEIIHVHFLEDGFTVGDRVRYRGEEYRIDTGSKEYRDQLDRNGRHWTQMSEQEQFTKFGKLMFRHGPWPFNKLDLENLEYDPNDVEAVKRMEKARQRGAPPPGFKAPSREPGGVPPVPVG